MAEHTATRGRPKKRVVDIDQQTRSYSNNTSEKLEFQKRPEFSKSKEIIHDLFKLEFARMQKNVAVDEQEPQWVAVEHCHFFHTVDSNGKKQTTSASIGGHFHLMEVIEPESSEDMPIVRCVSGPMQWARKKINGKFKRVAIPIVSTEIDDHRHDVEWIRQDIVSIRQTNTEAVKVVTDTETRQSVSVPGVVEK